MKKFQPLLFVLIGVVAAAPLVNLALGSPVPWLQPKTVAALNLVAWSILMAGAVWRADLHKSVERTATSLGLDPRLKSIETLLRMTVREVERKNSVISINILEKKITSKEELSKALERIVALAFKLLGAESAELALFDRESEQYHSALVLGKPFRSSAQAMLSGAAEGALSVSSPDVLVQPIAFAGSILGTLRVGLRKGTVPGIAEMEIMRLLAVQGTLALINAQYTGELMKMKQSSEASLRAKTGFLANLSHEVRAPLGIMLNAVELVLDGLCGPLNQDQLETLRMVHSNGEHLLELINDVLDYAKVEAGKLTPQKVDIGINDLLRDLGEVVRTQAESKSHKLIVRQSDEMLAISCDRRHARQMLINLLSNAIKYTPDNGTIELWADRAPGGKIKISVKDSGVGIDPSEHERVFAPFERVENNSYSMSQVGTGLGMPLTQRLAEVNGGTIDFTSTPGSGSHFWLLFRAVELNIPLHAAQAVPEEGIKGRGEMIMLVEKDDGERSMMARYLSHAGFKVAAASSRLEALETIRSKNVNLAIIDNIFADDSDEDVINTIRNDSRTASIPVILATSRAFVFDIEKYLRAGVDRCLIKPIKLSELGRICRELLDGNVSTKLSDEVKRNDEKKEKGAHEPSGILNFEDTWGGS